MEHRIIGAIWLAGFAAMIVAYLSAVLGLLFRVLPVNVAGLGIMGGLSVGATVMVGLLIYTFVKTFVG